MQVPDDNDLLREYVENDSGAAFAALVERHVNKVYSVALRHTGKPHQAEEITQAVFVILARKSRHLSRRVILSGWLYQTARLTAVTFIRSEIRRARREQEAQMQTLLNENEPDVWSQIAPLLDAAMAGLNKADRHAVMLRFFDGKSLREVGTALGASEDAAEKRVGRAVEKLRKFFSKRGVASTTAGISAAISANSVQAAPVMLVKTATAAALTKGALASGSTLTLINGVLKIMAWSKVKTAVVAGLVLVAVASPVIVEQVKTHRANMWEVQEPTLDLLRRATPQVRIVPTKYQSSRWLDEQGRSLGIAQSLKIIIGAAHGMWASQVVLNTPLPAGRYDVIANLPQGSPEALQAEIKKQFGVVATREMQEQSVLVLKVKDSDSVGLKPHGAWSDPAVVYKNGEYFWTNKPVLDLAGQLGFYFNQPVMDETGLAGRFDFSLKWDWKHPDPEVMKQALLDQLGLELVPARKPIEVLAVDKATN
jgi:uncharacterized protein (TIGR03435 family)